MTTDDIGNAEGFEQTVQDFFAYSPLYKKYRHQLAPSVVDYNRPVLLFHCHECKTERPFNRFGSRIPNLVGHGLVGSISNHTSGIFEFIYFCTYCSARHVFWTELNYEEMYICKLGQIPAYSIEVPKSLQDELTEEDFNLYKSALISLSVGKGIGACIYFRRVLENQINKLLEIYLDTRVAEKAPADELEYIREIISTVVAEDKIKLISKTSASAVPSFANNPITVTYTKLSDGLHNKSDSECVGIAQAAQGVLVRLLVDLKQEHEKQHQYKKDIEALSKT